MTEKDPFETLLDCLVASTRSPRGRFSAARSWPLLQARLKRTSLRRTLWMRVAGAAAIVLLCIAGWQAYEQFRPVEMTTVTAQAETRTVVLPDRTEVILNRYSTLTYPKDFRREARREVSLQGGAYFEVAKDPSHPFVVEAGEVQVEVLGTHFNVEAYPRDREVRTTLLEGSVAVSLPSRSQRLVLAPNERAVYHKSSGSLTQESLPNAADDISWSHGQLSFQSQPLREIVRQLANTYQTDIRIADPTLAEYRLTATFDIGEGLTHILDLLQAAAGFTYRQDKNQNIILQTKLNHP